MGETRTMNVEKELKGMTVLASDTGEKLGEITDAIVHPVEGRVLGILIRNPDGEQRALSTRDFLIGPDAVMGTANSRPIAQDADSDLGTGIGAIGDLKGSNVVTEDGKLIGRVSEVHISLDAPRTVYRVAESTLQRFLGGGFYIAGDVALAYSHDGVRMIVPVDTEERFAAPSVAEVLGQGELTAHQK